ncbi:MAG: biotin/lipoate--protein ligase family protein [Alphaproteobacteria bacterium]
MSPLVTLRTPSALDLPPGYRLIPLRESGDAFAHACRVADAEGAGSLVWVQRFDVAEFAVILEPDAPLSQARRVLFMGMAALADAVASLCPPERAVTIAFPDTLLFDGGLVGGGRLGWPKKTTDSERPDWLVFGAVVRVAFSNQVEPGATPMVTALDEEGFMGGGPAIIIEAFARYFMRAVDQWQISGFGSVEKDYIGRLNKDRPGDQHSLDDAGNLIIRPAIGEPRQLSLIEGLKAVAWLDRDSGGPRL